MCYTLTREARDGSRRDIRYNPNTSEIEGIDLWQIDERDDGCATGSADPSPQEAEIANVLERT